jgi:hypothetical protein
MNAGETGAELVSFILSEASGHDEIGKRIIANRVLEAVAGWLPPKAPTSPPATAQPMDDKEAKEYGKRSLGFGQHANEPIEDVPLEYLCWLADTSRQTWQSLHRYLNNPRIKTELEQEQ